MGHVRFDAGAVDLIPEKRREGKRLKIASTAAGTEFLALKQESRILGHSSNPVCGFSMMEQVTLCAV